MRTAAAGKAAAPAPAVIAADETWEDVLGAYKGLIGSHAPSASFCVEGLDREVILTAPEVMDPKTDAGMGYAAVRSLDDLIASKAVGSTAGMRNEAMLSVMDVMLAKETLYLKGCSVVQSFASFAYVFKLEALKSENFVLYAYCRAVLRTMDYVMRVVFSTAVRGEEEFVPCPVEIDPQADVDVEEIIGELEEAVKKVTGVLQKKEIVAQLQFRKLLLRILALICEAKGRGDVEAACGLCEEAVALLGSPEFRGRGREPREDKTLFREEVHYWVNSVTPTRPLPTPGFLGAADVFATMLRQLATVRHVYAAESVQAVIDFVEWFAMNDAPLLPTRALTVLVLFSRDPGNSFLYGAPLPQRVLEDLATQCGAPIYQRIAGGDDQALSDVVLYRVHKTMDALKVTGEQVGQLRQQTVDMIRRWSTEVSKAILVHLETMLCNRGRAHRRLMNAMASLAELQEASWAADVSVFLALQPNVPGEAEAECVKRSTVLTCFVNDFVMHNMFLVVSLTMELQLFSHAELLPALWYVNYTCGARIENLSLLTMTSTSGIPERRANKKTRVPLHNPVLTSRTVGRVSAVLMARLESMRLLCDAAYITACVMEGQGLLDVTSVGKYSLISAESTFNHRMKCFRALQSPPFCPYSRCVEQRGMLSDPGRAVELVRRAQLAARTASERVRALPASAAQWFPAAGLVEKSARAAAASLVALLAVLTEGEDAKVLYRGSVEYPYHPAVPLVRLQRK